MISTQGGEPTAQKDAGDGLEGNRDRVPGRAKFAFADGVEGDDAQTSRDETDPRQYPGMAHGAVGREMRGDVAAGDRESRTIRRGQREELV